MRTLFVRTENVHRLVAGLEELQRNLAVMPGKGLAWVYGKQGYGKTEATQWYAVQRHALYIRAYAVWSANWMLMEMAASLGLTPAGTSRGNLPQIREELYKRPRLVILDEADYIIRKQEILDTVRDLHDKTSSPFVLVGMAGSWEAVSRKSPPFGDRVSQVVEFTPLSATDVQVIAAELCDLKLTAEVAAQIQRQAEGNFRKTVVLLSHVETVRKANPDKEITDKVVDLAAKKLRAAG